jgi:uncharacterized delta-60 repeat protein
MPSLNINGRVEVVKLKANGQILIGGAFTSIEGFTLGRMALLNSNGTLDLIFNQNNTGAGGVVGAYVNDIEEAPDGKFLISGFFSTFNGTLRRCVARLNADGTLDTTYADNTALNNSMANDLELLASGKVVVGISNGVAIRMFNSDGSVDSGFTCLLTLNGRVQEILVQPDGKILVGGVFPWMNGVKRNSLARLNADGSLDASFTPYFVTDPLAPGITALAIQPDGKIYVAMQGVDQVFRMNTNGTRDTSFVTSSISSTTEDIVPLANGQVLVAGGLRHSPPHFHRN